MECVYVYRPCGGNEVYLPAGPMKRIYRHWGTNGVYAFTVIKGLLECIYRPWGTTEVKKICGVYLPVYRPCGVGVMKCIYHPRGANGVYSPSLRGYRSAFTVPPCGGNAVYLPDLRDYWSVFTVPIKCIYRPRGATWVYLPSLWG